MDAREITKLLEFYASESPVLIETHISRVILLGKYAYKIKKSVRNSFLDFSSPEERKFFCHREVKLNQRLTKGIYLDVIPVREYQGKVYFGSKNGKIIDYAVKMKRLQPKKIMSRMLKQKSVRPDHLKTLGRMIAEFHHQAKVIHRFDPALPQRSFNNIETVKAFIREHAGIKYSNYIDEAVQACGDFIDKNRDLIIRRTDLGFIRDCHGDLHAGNIFLYKNPVVFDCIEFNDNFRFIDVLNEIAFMCMDLEFHGEAGLSKIFLKSYLKTFDCMSTEEDRNLFLFYKSYRANVRAKANALHAMAQKDPAEITRLLPVIKKYLMLMRRYKRELRTGRG